MAGAFVIQDAKRREKEEGWSKQGLLLALDTFFFANVTQARSGCTKGVSAPNLNTQKSLLARATYACK